MLGLHLVLVTLHMRFLQSILSKTNRIGGTNLVVVFNLWLPSFDWVAILCDVTATSHTSQEP